MRRDIGSSLKSLMRIERGWTRMTQIYTDEEQKKSVIIRVICVIRGLIN